MFEKKAEEYAEGTKTEKELEVLNTAHIWGQESLSPDERRLLEGVQDRKRAREQGFKDGAEFGYNKAKEDVKYDLMIKLKDEGIVKPLKDSILRNERLSSQEQQELCAWIECAMDFGENLDKYAKELEQIRNERNLFQERCEDIEFNYYCDKVDCQFLSRNKWHYPHKGELPKEEAEYLVIFESDGTRYRGLESYYPNTKEWSTICNIIAWCEIPKFEEK